MSFPEMIEFPRFIDNFKTQSFKFLVNAILDTLKNDVSFDHMYHKGKYYEFIFYQRDDRKTILRIFNDGECLKYIDIFNESDRLFFTVQVYIDMPVKKLLEDIFYYLDFCGVLNYCIINSFYYRER